MALINETELRKQVELEGIAKTEKHLIESLKNGDLKPQDFSLRDLACITLIDRNSGKSMGSEVISAMHRNRIDENIANAVVSSSFSNITSQLYFNAMLEGYQLEEANAVSDLFGVVQTQIQQGEIVPGISNLGDAGRVLEQNEEYPMAAVGERFINTPKVNKMGFRVPISKEALITDRTGMVLEQCRAVGGSVRLAREKEACDVIINTNGATPRAPKTAGSTPYSSRGSNYAVWQSSAASLPLYDNVTSGNTLLNPGSINQAWLTLTSIKDPDTLEPVADSGPYVLLCAPAEKYMAMRILHGLQFRTTQTNDLLVSGPETVVGDFRIVSSKYLALRPGYVAGTWYFGNFKGFKWMRMWDILPEEALPNTGLSFTHDIAMQFKVSKMETASVHEPRLVTQCTVA